MQILIYVTALLLVFGILNYIHLDTYRAFVAIRAQFEQYMGKNERKHFSQTAATWYDSISVTPKEKDENKEIKKAKASSKLSLYPLLDKEKREPQLTGQVKFVLQQLIELLYSQTDFYREISEKRPEFIKELFEGIEAAADKLALKKQKISATVDLANLDLGDPQLNEVFYKMLKGTKQIQAPPKKGKRKNSSQTQDEPAPAGGYRSLLDFINVVPNVKLRLYLASRPMLFILTGDQATVEEILTTRSSLYNDISADPPRMKPAEADRIFYDRFQGRINPLVNNTLIDYSVTKTNPRDFE